MDSGKDGAVTRPSQSPPPGFSLSGDPGDRPTGLTLVEWREMRKGTLCGFATVRVNAVGLVIHDIPVLASGGGKNAWAGLPGKPIVGADGVAKRDPATGKLRYSMVLEWSDKRVADRFSNAVVEAVKQAHPGVVRS
jgi:hypothetical protein